MYIPKKYGESKIDKCPFCGLIATAKSEEGVPVCNAHKESKLPELRCACGSYLDIRTGKYGLFFNCINCGNINSRKVFEINQIFDAAKSVAPKQTPKANAPDAPKVSKEREKRILTVTSDDPRYFG